MSFNAPVDIIPRELKRRVGSVFGLNHNLDRELQELAVQLGSSDAVAEMAVTPGFALVESVLRARIENLSEQLELLDRSPKLNHVSIIELRAMRQSYRNFLSLVAETVKARPELAQQLKERRAQVA